MTSNGFFSTFSPDDPLMFFGTDDALSNKDWFLYVEYIAFAIPSEDSDKSATDYVTDNEISRSNPDGDEIGLILVDIGSHSDNLLMNSETQEMFLEELGVDDYVSVAVVRVDFYQEWIQWDWRVNEGDQWVIEVTGDIGCISNKIDMEKFQDFDSNDAYVGVTIKESGDDPPLMPTALAGWTVDGIELMTEEQLENLS